MKSTLSSLSPVRQTAIISAIAALLSVVLTGTVYLLFFGVDNRFWSAINMALLIPWAITVPLGLHMSKQRFKLVGLTNRLTEAQSKLRDANKALERRANFDGMTGLLSRDSFFNQLERMRVAERTSILMIVDVDHFKKINDNFGHPVGDRALVLLGRVFRKTLRQQDLVGRIGGEEFGIFLPETSAPEGQIIGEIIRHEIENTIFQPYWSDRRRSPSPARLDPGQCRYGPVHRQTARTQPGGSVRTGHAGQTAPEPGKNAGFQDRRDGFKFPPRWNLK